MGKDYLICDLVLHSLLTHMLWVMLETNYREYPGRGGSSYLKLGENWGEKVKSVFFLPFKISSLKVLDSNWETVKFKTAS